MVTILLPQNKKSAPLQAHDAELNLLESFESITIIGWVSCGQPIDIFTQEERIEVPTRLARKKNVCTACPRRLNERREYP